MENLLDNEILPCHKRLLLLNNYSNKLLVVILACITFFTATAQQVDYDITAHYTNDNGLPQNSINAMEQDANGFIWITTFGGLVRYDGNTLRVYNPTNTPALQTNSFWSLSLNNKDLEITPSFFDGTIMQIADSKTITTQKIPHTSHYAVTNGNGVVDFGSQYPGFLKTIDRFLLQSDKTREASGGWLAMIPLHGQQEGYIITKYKTLWYYNGDKGNLCYTSLGINPEYFMMGDILYTNIPSVGLVGWNHGKRIAKITGDFPALFKTVLATHTTPHQFYSKGDNAFVKLGKRLYQITGQNGNVNATLLSSHVPMPDITNIMYLPHENLLLIGTATTGLYIFKNKPFKSLLYQYPKQYIGSPQAQNSLYALHAIDDSTLLTTTGTIDLNGKCNVFKPGEWFPRSLIWLNKDNVLINGGAGLYQTNEKFEHPTPITGLQGGASTSLKVADSAYISVDSVLVKAIANGVNLTIVQQRIFKGTIVTSLAINQNGAIYIGTHNGLYLLHTDGVIDTIAGLEQTYITTLYKSTHNDIWIGTLSQGWYRLNKKGVVKMPMDTKGYLLRVHSFTEDSKGYMWMPTNNGLFRFLYSDLEKDDFSNADKRLFYNFFDKTYGSATSEYNGSCVPAMAKVKNGGFVFPSIQGLVLLYPNNIPVEQPNRPLLLEDVYADTTEVTGKDLTLQPNFNTLTMHVTTPFYGDHYNLQLEYKLSDEASKWIKVSETGNIRFNRLPSGNYHVYIRKISGYGTDNSQVVDFEFAVSPQWYRSLWFTVIWICAGGLFSLLYIRYKGKIAIKRQLELEKEVKNRTMALNTTMGILEETIEQLTASETKLKKTSEFREQVTSLVLHDIRSPLMFLDNITENIYSSSKELVPAALGKNFTTCMWV